MVIADLHIPLYDPNLLNQMINTAIALGIKKLAIGGDFWNMDTFSSYLPRQPEASWQVERYEGNYVMKTLLQTFDQVYFIWGNHDFRLTKATGFKNSFTECMKWAFNSLDEDEMSKIKFSDLDYMFIHRSGNDYFRLCHPQNYSKVPLTVPRQLAMKYETSIISAHSHHCSLGHSLDGKHIIMEAGGFFDKHKTEYIQRTNTNHEWAQGFISIKEGVPALHSPVIGNLPKEVKNEQN